MKREVQMDDVVITSLRKNARDMSGARESWFDDLWQGLDDAIVYAETAKLQSKVSDIGGVRRALERASAHFRIAREAVKKIEELDAEAVRAGSVAAK
jgi:hypothetical protein